MEHRRNNLRAEPTIPMWVIEQAVLVNLLGLATYYQIDILAARGELTYRFLVTAAACSASTLACQKIRSMADRQKEQNELSRVKNAHMTCASDVHWWSIAAQVFGVVIGVAQAPTWAHVAVAVYVAAYGPVWRRVYRHFWPATLDVPAETGNWVSPVETGNSVSIVTRGREISVIKDGQVRVWRMSAEAEAYLKTTVQMVENQKGA